MGGACARGGKEPADDAESGGLTPIGDSRQLRHGRHLLSAVVSNVLVVGKLDGTFSAVDLETGKILWSFNSGAPLVSSAKHEDGGGNPVPHVFPGADGRLYMVQRGVDGAKIERLAATVPELVETSPSLTDDGSLILGSQISTLYYVDVQTGELLRSVSSDKVLPKNTLASDIDMSRVLLMGRRDYFVRSVDHATGITKWNVSYSHMQHLDSFVFEDKATVLGFLAGKPAPQTMKSAPDAPMLICDRNSLHARDPTTGWAKWSVTFSTPPVVAFTPRSGGQDVFAVWSPLQEAHHQQPYWTSTTSMDAWAKLTQQKGARDDYVLIGEIDGGGLYALPAPGGVDDTPEAEQDSDSTAMVPKISYGEIVKVEDGNEMDYLSCLMGVQLLDDPKTRVAFLPNKSREEVDSTNWHFTKLLWGAFTMAAMAGGAVILKVLRSRSPPTPVKFPKDSAVASTAELKEDNPSTRDGSSSFGPNTGSNFPSSEPSGGSTVSAVSVRDRDGITHIGQLEIGASVLGYGAGGTVVYEGVFHGRPVAVKRVLKEFADMAANEKDILILSDEHPNLVRLFAVEEDAEFIYLALEKCQKNLSACITPEENLLTGDGLPTDKCLLLVNDVACGLAFLHARGIIHRDIKPHNVLIKDGRAKLSDMGLGRRLVADQSSFYSMGSGGSTGWQAPEQLLVKDGKMSRQTKAMDIFSLGCVMHYCLTAGKHPFGDNSYDRDSNILKGDADLSSLDKLPLAKQLISSMLEHTASKRPNMKAVLAHPFWWIQQKQLQFLIDLSDRIENEDRVEDKRLLKAFESCAKDATGGNWGARVDPKLISNLGQYRKYTYTSLRDLLRVIRNKHNHYREMSDELKELLGPIPEGFLGYFTTRFPQLLVTTYMFALDHCSIDLDKYFPEEVRCARAQQVVKATGQCDGDSGISLKPPISAFELPNDDKDQSMSTSNDSRTQNGLEGWRSAGVGPNGRTSPQWGKTSPVTRLNVDLSDNIPSDISLRPEKPTAPTRPPISLAESGRSRSGPLPPGMGLTAPPGVISLAEDGRSRSGFLPVSMSSMPQRSTLSLAEQGRSRSGHLSPGLPPMPIPLGEEGRTKSVGMPPGLTNASPPRGTISLSEDGRRNSGALSPPGGFSKRAISIADEGRSRSGILSPKIGMSPKLGPLQSGTGTRWDDVLSIISQDQTTSTSPTNTPKKASGEPADIGKPSAPTSPVSNLRPAFGNGLRTRSEPKWTSGSGTTLGLMDSGELSIGSPSSRTKDYSELQSPIKPKASAPNPLRSDLPIVGWEEDTENKTFTILNFPRRSGAQVCDFYLKTGFCKYHERCRFDHPIEHAVKLNEDGLPIRPLQPICGHYQQTHECKFGGACKFNHPNMKPIYAGSERSADSATISLR